MKEQMQELYVEDLANHNGPGHAVDAVRNYRSVVPWVRTGEVLRNSGTSIDFSLSFTMNTDCACPVSHRWL